MKRPMSSSRLSIQVRVGRLIGGSLGAPIRVEVGVAGSGSRYHPAVVALQCSRSPLVRR